MAPSPEKQAGKLLGLLEQGEFTIPVGLCGVTNPLTSLLRSVSEIDAVFLLILRRKCLRNASAFTGVLVVQLCSARLGPTDQRKRLAHTGEPSSNPFLKGLPPRARMETAHGLAKPLSA